MIRRMFFMNLLVFLVSPVFLHAQLSPVALDQSFAFDLASCQICDKADALVRLDHMVLRVTGPGTAVFHHRKVVTILNQDGRDHGAIGLFYDRFERITRLEGSIRDGAGKVVRKLKKDDQKDESAVSESSLYTDNRLRSAELFYNEFPYTVEFVYEVEVSDLIHWPVWQPQDEGLPLELGVFDVEFPSSYPLRYFNRNLDVRPLEKANNQQKYLRWEVHNLPLKEPEPLGPSWQEQIPEVYVAAKDFTMENTHGDMSSWTSFGAWSFQLWSNLQGLTPEIRAKVAELTGDVQSPKEKVARLYRFLQSTTRYVSIQQGLGGWKPFSAESVCKTGYGDCKALVNYMKVLLEQAGITSYPAIIRSGVRAPDLIPEFPHNAFNHVILMVPVDGDSLWLECTSSTNAPGHLGSFTENRWALLVTPEGGKLVRTPSSTSGSNRQSRTADVVIDLTGNGTARVQTTYTGNQADDIRGSLFTKSGKDREEWLHENVNIAGVRIVSADYSSIDRKEETVTLPLQLVMPRYATLSGQRLFINPNLMERAISVPNEVKERTQPVVFTYPYLDTDSIRFQIPAGYKIESVSEPLNLEESFGSYQTRLQLEGNTLIYVRRLEMKSRRLPPDAYETYRAFRKKMVAADRSQVVLVKN